MDDAWKRMDEQWERLTWARLQSGRFRKMSDAARALSTHENTYRSYERPKERQGRGFDEEFATRAGKLFGVSGHWLYSGKGSPVARADDTWRKMTADEREEAIALWLAFKERRAAI